MKISRISLLFLVSLLISCYSKFPKNYKHLEVSSDSLITQENRWPTFSVYYDDQGRNKIIIQDPKWISQYYEIHRSKDNQEFTFLYKFPPMILEHTYAFFDGDSGIKNAKYKLKYTKAGKIQEKPATYFVKEIDEK